MLLLIFWPLPEKDAILELNDGVTPILVMQWGQGPSMDPLIRIRFHDIFSLKEVHMTEEEKDELAYDIQKIFWIIVLIGPFVIKMLIILKGVLWPDGQ